MPAPNLTTAGKREFRAAIVRPRSFAAGKKYPVIVHVYAGPHSNTVNISPRRSHSAPKIRPQKKLNAA